MTAASGAVLRWYAYGLRPNDVLKSGGRGGRHAGGRWCRIFWDR
jgi:hypothetical protein